MSVSASNPEGGGQRPGIPGVKRLVLSLTLWLLLYAVSLAAYNNTYHLTSAVFIRWFQVLPSVRLLELTLPALQFEHTATTIRTAELELHILRGCDGVEAWLLLITALLVFPMSWRRRWLGVVWGSLLIYTFNLVRIVSLFHLSLRKPEWFEVAHGVVWQSVIVLAAAAFILSWLDPRRLSNDTRGFTA